jgi:DNA-binding NtrC family response regulator
MTNPPVPINTIQKSAPRQRERGTIVVMDDQVMIRETVAAMLESLGYQAVCTQNGRDTLDFFRNATNAKAPIAGMLLDLTIPGGMGGVETVKEIRKFDKLLPVFVSSGHVDIPEMQDPGFYGFTAGICKPFRMAELEKMLGKYLK